MCEACSDRTHCDCALHGSAVHDSNVQSFILAMLPAGQFRFLADPQRVPQDIMESLP